MISSGYRPLYQSDKRIIFFFLLLSFIIISLISGENIELEMSAMRPGILVNANNLSLISLSLLFLINNETDSLNRKIIVHALVIAVLFISATLGALFAYASGAFFKHRRAILQSRFFYLGLAIVVLLFIVTPYLNLSRFYLMNKITSQVNVIFYTFNDLISMQKIDYGTLLLQYGPSGLSGIWRMEFWISILDYWIHSDFIQLFIGHGLGSSALLFGNVPHNEYLRILVEQGFIGLCLIIFFYITIYGRLHTDYRYLLIIFSIFSFTENNLDNYLYMSLLMFFLASSQYVVSHHEENLP